MNYKNVSFFVSKWALKERRIRALCESGRVDGAMKVGHSWMIPENAKRPVDKRYKEIQTNIEDIKNETFEKLPRTKVFKDPLYGYIKVDYKVISDLIDSKEVQRLRRIRQLSGVLMVFQTAEHSRFTHSLGAYQMANLAIQEVEGLDEISEYEKLLFLVSALLHDIGHGPYSHSFENITKAPHEGMTVNIILSKSSEVNKILCSYSEFLARDAADVINHGGRYPLIESLISSQLDVDRMDYLSRDAYFTGAVYGTIDVNRLFRSMKIVDGRVLIRASGVNSVESYIMSRYHMYFQVYYHPIARSYESVLENILRRIVDIRNKIDTSGVEYFLNIIDNPNDVASYIEIDDAYVNGFIKKFERCDDIILSRLCTSFMNRHLYSFVDLADEPNLDKINEIKQKYSKEELKYYYLESHIEGVAYLKSSRGSLNDIKVLLPNGNIKPLDEYSLIVKGLTTTSRKMIDRIYYFEK